MKREPVDLEDRLRRLPTHTHTHARTYTHTHTHARTRTHAHTRAHTRAHAHARTHTHACTHAHAHARTRTHTPPPPNIGPLRQREQAQPRTRTRRAAPSEEGSRAQRAVARGRLEGATAKVRTSFAIERLLFDSSARLCTSAVSRAIARSRRFISVCSPECSPLRPIACAAGAPTVVAL